eukprot:g11918.t1
MFTNRPSRDGGGGGGRRPEQVPAPPQQQPRNRGGSNDSSRGASRGGSSFDASVSNSRSSRTAVQARPSTAQPVIRTAPMARQATAAALVPAAVAAAPATPTNTATSRPPPPSYSSMPDPAPASGSFLPAAALLPGGMPVTINEPELYLCTDDYPFTSKQYDRQRELRLGLDVNAAIDEKVPLMDSESHKQLNLTSAKGSTLQELDLECARKHLEAIKDSVATHEELHGFTLFEDEEAVKVLDLAGLENAPGLLSDVTQQCRVVFTTKRRLVFTQANHSAEVGQTPLPFLAALLTCCHDRWSRRKWVSYYASIDVAEVLQVFVQQTLSTSYQNSHCTCRDCYDSICCPMGGAMFSQKDMDGATQTLGDNDPGNFMRKFDKQRHLRHALVIRYVDLASNAVLQTTAMAHPSTPARELYEMARSIDANITMTMADWLKHKALPTPLVSGPFQNEPPSPPLFHRTSYKALLFVLFAIALGFFALNVTAAVFMSLSVFVALFGSFFSMNRGRNHAARAVGSISKTLLGTQGAGLVVYAISFAAAVSSNTGDDDDQTSTSPFVT